MEYSLRAMELWFQHLPGSLLLELERKALENWFSQCTGTHCLQIGGPSDLRLIESAHYSHKTYLSSHFASAHRAPRIQSSLGALPIVSGSIDSVVLIHLLEFSESPEQLLEETYRILAPEGQFILLSFNMWSLWGITRLQREKRGFPWAGQFHSNAKMKRWLREAGYSILLSKTLCFRPVLHNAHQSERWSFMESVGAYCFPGFGAVSLMIAQKRESGMTPIKVSWNRRRLKVGGRVIEPTSYR